MQNGDSCIVIAGTHKGKTGTVEDRHVSKGGNVTITVRQADGNRFKTVERSVRPSLSDGL
jgi:ribosomal protein S4E